MHKSGNWVKSSASAKEDAGHDHAVTYLQLLQAAGCDKLLRQIMPHFTAFTFKHHPASGQGNSSPDANSVAGLHDNELTAVSICGTAQVGADSPCSSTVAAQQASACQLEDSSSSSSGHMAAPQQGVLTGHPSTGHPPMQAAFWRHAGSLAGPLASKAACVLQKAVQRSAFSKPALADISQPAPIPTNTDSGAAGLTDSVMEILASVDLLTQCIDSSLLLLDSSADQPQEPPLDMSRDQLDAAYFHVYVNADVISLCLCWLVFIFSFVVVVMVSVQGRRIKSLAPSRGKPGTREPAGELRRTVGHTLYAVNTLHWLWTRHLCCECP